MDRQVVIVDYGMGNLYSVARAVEAAGGVPLITSDPGAVDSASALIMPGVGTFGDCMANLRKTGLLPALRRYLEADRPYLGICLGMQVLFQAGEETPGVEGIGFFKGKAVRIPTEEKLPHVGWNRLRCLRKGAFVSGQDGGHHYYIHSYCCEPEDGDIVTATTDYGMEMVAAVEKGRVLGLQFHPEKSDRQGILLLRKFIDGAYGTGKAASDSGESCAETSGTEKIKTVAAEKSCADPGRKKGAGDPC